MRWIAGAMLAGAIGATTVAAPEWDAGEWNREMRTACVMARAARPSAECPPPKREDFRTDWLLIAAMFAVGSAVVAAIGARR
jgi:hypothetical protein